MSKEESKQEVSEVNEEQVEVEDNTPDIPARVVRIADAIINDEPFKTSCIQNFMAIFEDGVVDHKDIGHIVSIVMVVAKKRGAFERMTKNQEEIKQVLKKVTIALLNEIPEYQELGEMEKEICEQMLDVCLNLAVFSINKLKLGEKLKKGLCCCMGRQRSIPEEKLVNASLAEQKNGKQLELVDNSVVVPVKAEVEEEHTVESSSVSENTDSKDNVSVFDSVDKGASIKNKSGKKPAKKEPSKVIRRRRK